MKKLILSLIAVAVGTLSSFAQSDLVATLSHGSSLTTFTGADALSDAYTAAAEGDVITLSPGVFNAVDIEKAITIRGAGMQPMESNGYVATQLANNITINVPSGASSTLTIEGINVLGTVSVKGTNLAPITFSKCRFNSAVGGNGVSMNAHSCVFSNGLSAVNSYNKNTTLNCYNCVIVGAQSSGYDQNSGVMAKIVATNCLVNLCLTWVPYCVFTNCIITSSYNSGDNYPLPETCSAQNCLGINVFGTPNLFQNIIGPTSVMAEGSGTEAFASIFKTLTTLNANPAITETFELTETAAATYLGDDGTQVGIYGGTNPFNPTPTNPQVKKFTVSSTTEGDQLKVKINVE